MVTGSEDPVTPASAGGKTSRLQIQGSRFVVTELYLVANAAGDVLLVPDPLRVLIVWSVHAGDTLLISTKPNALAGQGLRLLDTQSPFAMDFVSYGHLVQGPWYAGGITIPCQVTVLTMDYHEDW